MDILVFVDKSAVRHISTCWNLSFWHISMGWNLSFWHISTHWNLSFYKINISRMKDFNPFTAISQQDPEKSNITVGFFIVLYRIWALFAGTNKDKILSRALFEIFIKNWWFVPFFQCRFYWVFWKSFLTAYLNSWWNFHSFDRSHCIILSRNAISHF